MSENALVANGHEIVIVRRQIWDLERRQRYLRVDELEQLKSLRRKYRNLLAIRKALVQQSRTRMFDDEPSTPIYDDAWGPNSYDPKW